MAELLHGVLPSWPLLVAFFLASFVLAVTPGPGVFYIVTRTLTQGRRAGLASVAGVALGNLGNAIGAAIGLAAVFAVSSLAFAIAGAAYLIYLGVRALRSPPDDVVAATFARATARTIFRDGFVVALFNPKTAIFFAAFLPQFLNPGASPIGQSVLLGALFVLVAAATDSAYALAAGAVAPALSQLRRVRTAGRYLSASAFIGLGVFAAASDSRR